MKDRPKLFVRNDKGKFEEYKRPDCDNALYRRIGNKYVPVNMQMNINSWQEGVFAVTRVHSSLYPDSWTSADYLQEIFRLYKCGEIEKVSIGKLAGMKKLADHLARNWEKISGNSVYEQAASIVAILMDYEDKNEF